MVFKSLFPLPLLLALAVLLSGCSPDGVFNRQGRQPDFASLSQGAATEAERGYWRLCGDEQRCRNNPDKLARFAGGAYAFGLAHPQSPFGARAIVLAADARANAYDFSGAIEYFNKAAEIFTAHGQWPETAQVAPYIGLRLGDALNNDGRFAAAFEQWKMAALTWPNSNFMNQFLVKIRELNPKAFRPEEAWQKKLEFFDEALQLTSLNQSVRDSLRIGRIDVLMPAASEFYVPATQVIGEIDALLTSSAPGQSRAIDTERGRLEHLREELRTKFPAWTRADYERNVLNRQH